MLKKLNLLLASIFTCVILMSAASSSNVRQDQPTTTVVNTEKPAMTKREARKARNQEIRQMAEQIKGKKLTFKERLALKIFGKKIDTIRKNTKTNAGDNQVVALVLVLLVGGLGVHRFYLGYVWQGIVQLLTLGGCGIWTLIDLIRIITGNLKPKGGEYSKTL
ncbi:MAG: TM2 domain-containing protein [Microscillaceae bacterium]|jgi:TM2 domain-containing membrane protein YozV|nr:TM2 domain-containing protein [Microscillaceae bacterium]